MKVIDLNNPSNGDMDSQTMLPVCFMNDAGEVQSSCEKLKTISLAGIGNFGLTEIQLDSKRTFILGRSGIGKTLILQRIIETALQKNIPCMISTALQRMISGDAKREGETSLKAIEFASDVNEGNVYFGSLPMGMKSVYQMGLELAKAKGHGIAAIDDIDAFLHPKMQVRIKEAMQNHFPKIQFVCATHSPLVVHGLDRCQIILLEKEIK